MRLARHGQAQQAGRGRIGDVLGGLWEERHACGCPGNDAYGLRVSSSGVHTYGVVDKAGETHRVVTA
ncbi:hypothetical protein [Embleya sp. NPDC050493]|uniref:hypothetical protein n=1 Tax=Embleya sp. NPDC050493 TaxID=3363989 RepID=UPI00378F4015